MTDQEITIEVKNLTKFYGDYPAIEDLSFSVNKGEILGFLGPNGAGKTTTMRILTGFMPPSGGTAKIAGFDVVSESLDARKQIGYLPETVPLYLDMTVEDYLDFLGKIRGMDRNWRQKRISDVIGICHLEEYQSSHIGKLSKGFRQRVGIAQAILHEPKVLVMDEPTIGIDPIQVVETRNLIRSLGGEHTVLLSTHILPEGSTVCERGVIIHEGQVVAIDKPQILSERLSGAERVEADIRGPATEIMSALRDIAGIRDVSRTDDSGYSTYYIESSGGEDLREKIANTISERGWGLQRMQPILMTLEEIFLSLTNREK